MKKKIVGIVICMLLISSTTTLALTPFNRNEQQRKHQLFDATPMPLPTSKGWMKTFGRPNSSDIGYSVQQTTDGGYIIVGETDTVGKSGDIWVIKTDEDGNKVWDKTFGGLSHDYYPNVKQTRDNGYIISARTFSFGAGETDIWVIKLDENGTEQWNTTFGKQFYDYSSEIQQTTDGGYIIVGSVNLYEPLVFDAWLIKIDSQGNEQWNRTFGEPQQEDFGSSVQQTSDGGYIVAGSTMSYGHNKGYAMWLIKTDGEGNAQWNITYGEADSWGGASSVELTSDGGYIILGNREYYESNQSDIRIIKTNQYGDEQWNKTYGGTLDDFGSEIHETTDGGYIIIGTIADYIMVEANVWIIKTDASGDMQWNRTFGGPYWDTGCSGDQTSDGGYIITGGKCYNVHNSATYDVWLIKTDSTGKSKTTPFDNLWFERFFQRFPHAFPMLRHILGF
jgi:hypothetical protein